MIYSTYRIAAIIFLFALTLWFPGFVDGHEISGNIAVEGRLFLHNPTYDEQKKDNYSFSAEPEYYKKWENDVSFTFVPFIRIDSADDERSHADIREFNFLWTGNRWELRLGIGKVFWGVTEFVHLVDIINQTDLVENIDGEDKLGQTMGNLSIVQDWGVVDLFILPHFRERTFPGKKGRLRTAAVVDNDKAEYESSAEQYHIDFAVRYSHTIDNWDFGIYHFKGTGREPTLFPGLNDRFEPILIPFYEQIDQTGLDVQLVTGRWLFKLEALYRVSKKDEFLAGVAGFEYTLTRVFDTQMDLGIIGELSNDERGSESTLFLGNDAMIGLRWAINDAASTEILFGFTQDLRESSRSLSLESSKSFGNNWKLTFDSKMFFDLPIDDPFSSLLDDDYLQLVLAYYF